MTEVAELFDPVMSRRSRTCYPVVTTYCNLPAVGTVDASKKIILVSTYFKFA